MTGKRIGIVGAPEAETVTAHQANLLYCLRAAVDHGGFDGFGPDALHASAADEIERLIKVNRALMGLLPALNEMSAIVRESLVTLIESHAIRHNGAYVISTLDDAAKPDFERFTNALNDARKAIEKAGSN